MKIVVRFALVLLGLYVIAFGFLYSFQESIIFQDHALATEYQFQFDTPFEEKTIQREEGAILHGINFRAQETRGLILYFHGNAGDLSRWGKIVEPFVARGYDVLAVDYRGYGKSVGKRNESLMYEDALAWYDFALGDFDEESITVYGRSLGCTFATYVASERSCRQLILETPFYSLKSVASNTYAIFPLDNLLKFTFPSYQFIGEVECPITIIHGTEDLVVPLQNSRRLIGLNPQINYVTIEDGEHNNLSTFKEYWQTIEEVLPAAELTLTK